MTVAGVPRWRSRARRAAKWLLAVILVAVALQWVGRIAAERYVRGELEVAAAAVCALVDPQYPPRIVVDLSARSVSITGLRLLPAVGCPDASVHVQGRIDTARVSGVSLIGVLFRDRAVMDNLQLRIAEARIVLVHDSLNGNSNDRAKGGKGGWSFDIGSFAAVVRSTTVITPDGDTLCAHGSGIEVGGKDLRFMIGKLEPLASLGSEHMHLWADSLTGNMANGYNWSVGQCLFDQQQGTLDLLRMNIGPALAPEAFSATLPYETDVIEARLDTLHATGFDMNAALAERTLSMRSIRVASGAVTVLRDKVILDGNDPEQPLPGRLIRSFPLGSGTDSVLVAGLDVQYLERVDRQRGYAIVPFTRIHATITGAKHSANDTSMLVVRASALAFGTASVSLFLRTMVADTTDRFETEASIGPLPFSAINAATGPLLDIRATEGWIDTLVYRMIADDQRASGVVRMRHHGLRLASGGRKSEQAGNQIESALLNAVVRNKHNNKSGDAREGRFAFERRKDRKIFNYLWSGLREGVKAELLPEALTR